MKKTVLIYLTLFAWHHITFAQDPPIYPYSGNAIPYPYSLPVKQQACPNGGLENNNLTGWNQYCGLYSDPINTLPLCNDPQRASVVSQGTDAVGGFPTVFSGNRSLRLGDNIGGRRLDLVYFPITVTNANKDFKFRYAVVMEDPTDHQPSEKPLFSYWCNLGNKNAPQPSSPADMALYNSTVKTIIADRTNPFWSLNGSVVYKRWQCVNIDLSAYVGQTVSVCFMVKDCNMGGHFGYAYIDGLCDPDLLNPDFILPAVTCNNNTPIIVDARSSTGEDSYYWELSVADGSGNYSRVVDEWFYGQTAGLFDLKAWLAGKNIRLECNKKYGLRLIVASACSPWKAIGKFFTFSCPEINKTPDMNICCPVIGENCITFDAAVNVKSTPNNPFPSMPALSYNWTSNPGNGNSIGNTSSINVCPTKSTQYIVTVTDDNNCTNGDTINVYFRGPLSLEVLSLESCCKKNYSATIREHPCSENDINSNYAYTVNWSTTINGNSQVISNGTSLSSSPSGGNYTITASNLCHTTNSVVAVPPQDPGFPDLIMPNTIRLNSSIAVNRIMTIQEYGINAPFTGQPAYNADKFELYIFNRWGSVIRKVTEMDIYGYSPACLKQGDIYWDGKDSQGATVKQDDYVWKLRLWNKCTGIADWVCTTNAQAPPPRCKDWCIIWPHWWQPIWTCCNYTSYGEGCAYHILVLDF